IADDSVRSGPGRDTQLSDPVYRRSLTRRVCPGRPRRGGRWRTTDPPARRVEPPGQAAADRAHAASRRVGRRRPSPSRPNLGRRGQRYAPEVLERVDKTRPSPSDNTILCLIRAGPARTTLTAPTARLGNPGRV